MSQIGQDKHDFLYYIFQFDRKCHILDKEKENGLRRLLRKMMTPQGKGD